MHVDLLGRRIDLDAGLVAESRAEIRRQLEAYQAEDRRSFDLTIDYPGGFTGEVHRAIAAIPYGETRTYGELARELDTAPIAVGGACTRNPLPVVIPCHRMVGTDSLRGYLYPGLQERLLELEGATVDFDR